MPDLIVSNPGERYLLSRMVRDPWVLDETWTLHLFKNDYTPNRDTGLGDFTEANYAGYVPVVLLRENWTEPVTITGTAVSFYGAEPIQFYATSGLQTIYGYYISVQPEDEDESLILSQRFDGAFNVTAAVPAIVFPQLRLHSEYEPPPP